MNDKMLHMLGLARRAGKLALGTEAAQDAVRKHKSGLVLLASDLSPRTVRNFVSAAQETGAKTVSVSATMDEIGAAVGKRTGVIAVNDTGFANRLLALSAED